MKLHDKEEAMDTLGSALRLVGLRAAIQKLQGDHRDAGGSMDYHMEWVVRSALRFEGNEAEKQQWLDTIVAVIDEHHGFISAFESTIATTIELMPEAFLSHLFKGTEMEKRRRLFFIQNEGLRQSPLATTDVDVLIKWCRAKDDNGVWPSIAAGINLWSTNGDEAGVVTISESALRFLETSPRARSRSKGIR